MEPADVLKKYARELLSLPVHQPTFIALLKKHNLLHGNTEKRIKSTGLTTDDGAQLLVDEITTSLVIFRDNFDKLILVMKEYKDGGMEELAKKMETDVKPNPSVPILPTNIRDSNDHKSQEKQVTFQGQTSVSTSDLSVHFSTFVMTIRKMLEKCVDDKLESCKEICSTLTIGNSDILLFSDEQLDNINKCKSFEELFKILRRHWSWKEYSLLRNIIAICDSEEANAELDKFEKLMSSYFGMKLISEKYSPSELPVDYVKLCITIDKPYKSLTLQDFYKLQAFIFKHLDVQEYITLPFIKFLFSSLHLELYIPVQAVSYIVKMICINKKDLIQKSIVLIKIGDKCILDTQSKSLHTDGQFHRPDTLLWSPSKEHSHMVCPACNQLFKNPKYLPCYHSYCEACLEKMQERSMITCLKCRNEAVVPVGGVKDIPSNYFMKNLVNKLVLNYKLENETKLRCEDCNEDNPLLNFCTNCKLFLCHFCTESHKYSKSCNSHNLISLKELKANRKLIQSVIKFPTCQEHDLELQYYCETCEKLVCIQCTREHEDHEYNVVKKIASKYKNELQETTASIEIMTEDLSKLHDLIEDMKTTITQQGDEISEEIDLYYDEVIKKLLEQKEKIKQEVHDIVLQKQKALKKQLEEVICTQEDIINLKKIKDSLQTRCDQEVLSTKNELVYSLLRLSENYEKVGTKPIESANIIVTPVNEPLPQIVKYLAIIDSLSFEVKDFNNFVQRGKMTMLELIAKDNTGKHYLRGGSEVTAQLESRLGEVITTQVIDHNNGTYLICFAAQQVGEIKLSVFVNGHEIKRSPFIIVVQENVIEPNKIITTHGDSFGQLWGIACCNNGMWAVADRIKNCVHVFDSQDNLIKTIGSRSNKSPFYIAFDDNNDLYVVDSHNHKVQKFDTHGNYLFQFGGIGAGEGQLNYPIGITTHQNKLYIADRKNNRISVFQNDGKFHHIIGQQKLSQCFDVTVNVNSEILVADWGHHCIYIFTLDGHYINTITLHESLDLQYPCSITTDSNGFILIADTSMRDHCISVFDKIGNCIYCFESDYRFFPRGIAVGPNGNIYISDTGNKRVLIFPGYCYS